MQKAPKRNRPLAWHQLNAPRQRNHLQLLAGAQAELLTHPLGDDDLVLGGYGCDIHLNSVAQDRNRSENSSQLDGGYGYDGSASGMSRRAHQRPEFDQLDQPNRDIPPQGCLKVSAASTGPQVGKPRRPTRHRAITGLWP
jgi:hypothetical protein